MSGHMSEEEIAQWMQEQHQALLALNRVLKEHIVGQPGVECADWLHGLKEGFKRLRSHLRANIELKRDGGYLSHVIEVRPTLSKQVSKIKHEHSEILKMAEWIIGELDQVTCGDRLLIADACARIQRFMAIVAQHDQQEAMISMLVFNQDIGGIE
jgi:hypothetical protein